MKKHKGNAKRIRKLFVGCVLCAIVLTVSTYAWFVGMKTVNVSSFDVSIAAIDGLTLSLDGDDFKDTVAINSTNYNDTSVVYEGNTNSWSNGGLIPMSSVGVIDTSVSRLTLFEKGSFTTTPGGYRIMASRVDNKTVTVSGETRTVSQGKGYVVFDLFIKNLSGNQYYSENNELNEEAIYLTTDSKVTGILDGGDTGIQNSVRVAFAQIGRVKATETNPSTITGITCAGDGTKVTGICRTAQIWEPNDTAHIQNALNWYATSCRKRTGGSVTNEDSYSGLCKGIGNGYYYPTYAISGEIDYDDSVDIYDGKAYNSYIGSIATTPTEGKLMEFNYFTDSEKNLTGVNRPTFITLAPNSITKVRVYVYIEGQDIDNYDFASLGKKISVEFGFTKERYFDEDIEYSSAETATLPTDVIREEHPISTPVPQGDLTPENNTTE